MSNNEKPGASFERESVASEAEIKSVLDSVDMVLAFYDIEAKEAAMRLDRNRVVPLIPTQALRELGISRSYQESGSGHQALIIRSFDRLDLGPDVYERQVFHIYHKDGQLSATRFSNIRDPHIKYDAIRADRALADMELEETMGVPASDCRELAEQIAASQPF